MISTQPTDSQLLSAFVQSRSSDALTVLIHRHAPAVHAAATRQLGDASMADDVTQAVFVILIQRPQSVRRPELLAGWLLRATRYCALTARRAQRRRAAHEAQALPPASGGPPAMNFDLMPRVDAALDRLGEVDRTIVTLNFLDSQSIDDIAIALRMNSSAVRKRAARAIGKLRRDLTRGGMTISAEMLTAMVKPDNAASLADLPARVSAASGNGASAPNVLAKVVARRLWMQTAKYALLTGSAAIVLLGSLTVGAIELSHHLEFASLTVPTPPTPLPRGRELGSIYTNADDPSAGWSVQTIGRTPKSQSPFLGPFASEATTLKLNDLPKHDFIRIRADLYLINTLDGVDRIDANMGVSGPDFFSLALDDRPALIRSTISATPNDSGFGFAAKFHTLGSVIPSYPILATTGGVRPNELGYVFTFRQGISFPMDGVYSIDITLPHSAATLALTASGHGLGNVTDEGWGLANVKIDAVPAAPRRPFGELDALFQAAASMDVITSRDAFWKLVAAGDAAVAFLKQQPIEPGFNTADVEQRIATVAASQEPSDASFPAEQDLVAMGPGVEPLLMKSPLFSGPNDPAIRRIMEAIDLRPIQDPAARAAAVKARVLAVIATPAATAALDNWFAAAKPYEPDLLRKFETEYHPAEGAALTYIAHPDPDARSAYIETRRQFLKTVALDNVPDFNTPHDAPDTSLLFYLGEPTPNLETPAFSIHSNLHLAARNASTDFFLFSDEVTGGPMRQLMQHLARAREMHQPPWQHVVLDDALLNMSLPGDWIVRFGASQDERMSDLTAILSRQLGKPVNLQPQKGEQVLAKLVGQPTLPPASTWPSATEPSLPDRGGSLPKIDIYLDAADLNTPSPMQPFNIQLNTLMVWLNIMQQPSGQPALQRMDPAYGKVLVRTIWHPAAMHRIDRDAAQSPENRNRFDQIFANVAAQIGMTVDHTKSTVSTYRMTVAPDKPLN